LQSTRLTGIRSKLPKNSFFVEAGIFSPIHNPSLLANMGYNENAYDVEKRAQSSSAEGNLVQHHGKLMQEDGAVPGDTFVIGDSWYAKTQRLAGKLKIEQRGIERVPEDERDDTGLKGLLNVMTMVCPTHISTSDHS
jgi:hypothetical protein